MAYELKTKVSETDVQAFLNEITDKERREDCLVLLKMMENLSGEKARIWGGTFVGFGTFEYKAKSGHTGEWPLIAFSSRKQFISVQIISGFQHEKELMNKLGKYKNGASCLNIKKLSDIDLEILSKLVKSALILMKSKYKAK